MNIEIILLITIGISALFIAIGAVIDNVSMGIWGLAILCFSSGLYIGNKTKEQTYKVHELERNTVFTITDKEGAYNVNDSVWVNLSTRKIDTKDSNAMLCVIIKEL